MKLLFLLALVSLASTETPSSTAATTTIATQQAPASSSPGTPSKSEKEKRTTVDEASPQNIEYTFSDEDQPTRYVVPQEYLQAQSPKHQVSYVPQKEYLQAQSPKHQVSYVPQKESNEPKKEQNPQTTYTIQYVPAQHISHSIGYLPKYQTQPQSPKYQTQPQSPKYQLAQSPKYQFVSKTQQQPIKGSAPSQNSLIPNQHQYYLPPSFQNYAGSQFVAPPTFLHSVPSFTPGHHYFSPPAYQTPTYLVPVPHASQQYQQPQEAATQISGPAYNLQPIVMMFTLPGGHYLNSPGGQSALLSFLSGSGSLGALGGGARVSSAALGSSYHPHPTPHTPYVIQRQQLTYLIPPVSRHTSQATPQVSQPTVSYSQPPQIQQQPIKQQSQQPSPSSSGAVYRYTLPKYHEVKG